MDKVRIQVIDQIRIQVYSQVYNQVWNQVKIRQAIKETTYLLNKELKYSVDLQKADMIIFYRQHIATLTARLNNF
jgi:hypothetical protein